MSDQLYKDEETNNISNATTPSTENLYRLEEKKYKSTFIEKQMGAKRKKVTKAPIPDLSEVFRFNVSFEENCTAFRENVFLKTFAIDNTNHASFIEDEQLQFKDIQNWKIFGLKSHTGFYFIPNPFTVSQQLHWIKQCLETYLQPPNLTNLHHHYPNEPMKDLWKQAHSSTMDTSQKLDAKTLLSKLTWCTLGYQYRWTERKYEDQLKVAFPTDWSNVVKEIANRVGYGPYQPEAAIINYYQPGQTMGGHVDDAEYEMTKPIVSVSFGHSAIFLLGGETRQEKPVPILIQSGDVVIMGGRARNCFHGVARVLEKSLPHYLEPENVPEEYKEHCQYLQDTRRLNINARQVHCYDEKGSVIK